MSEYLITPQARCIKCFLVHCKCHKPDFFSKEYMELSNEAGYQKKRADSLLEFTEKLKSKIKLYKAECERLKEALELYRIRSNIPVGAICMSYVDGRSTYQCIEDYIGKAAEALKQHEEFIKEIEK